MKELENERPEYAFRPATAANLPMFARWLRTPEVVRWWGNPAEQLGLLEEDLSEPKMVMRVVSFGGRPFAYAQDYDVRSWPQPHFTHLPPGTRAIDAFIGEPDMIGRGHGSAFLRHLAVRLRTAGAPIVAIDPDVDNHRARRAYAKAGFRGDRIVETASGPAVLMLFDGEELDRPAESCAQSRPMANLSDTAKERPQEAKATLGDVLYAKSKAPVSEQDWAALVQSIAAGDQLALHALYERAHRIVFTLIMRITANRETAEEITIDVFHDVWRRASQYDAVNGTVLGWIMNQARSRAIDRLRFESRKKRQQVGDLHEVAPDPRDVLELREQGASMRAALAVLTPDERRAIETTFFGGLTHAEAATRLNQPLGTIKTRIRSGLHKLRHALTVEAEKP